MHWEMHMHVLVGMRDEGGGSMSVEVPELVPAVLRG